MGEKVSEIPEKVDAQQKSVGQLYLLDNLGNKIVIEEEKAKTVEKVPELSDDLPKSVPTGKLRKKITIETTTQLKEKNGKSVEKVPELSDDQPESVATEKIRKNITTETTIQLKPVGESSYDDVKNLNFLQCLPCFRPWGPG